MSISEGYGEYIARLFCVEYGIKPSEIERIDVFNDIVKVTARPRKEPEHLWMTVIVKDEEAHCEST